MKVSQQNEYVTVQRLPNGMRHDAVLGTLKDNTAELSFPDDSVSHELSTGTLIEIDTHDVLYLGEVQGRKGSLLIVGLEHAVSKDALAAIQDIWQES